MASLFALQPDNSLYETKYEASGVILVNGTTGYAICDSSWSLYQFGLDLQPWSAQNVQWQSPPRQAVLTDEVGESGYEDLSFLDNTFFVVRESIQLQDGSYHAIIEEIQLPLVESGSVNDHLQQNYTLQRQCVTELELEGDSKGLEGLLAIHDLDGDVVLLGLCEGNHCSEKYKDDRGNGRIVIMKQQQQQQISFENEGDCLWKTVRMLDIPPSADFTDYSAMAIDDRDLLAITSQEDSQLWIGRLLGKDPDTGRWDIDMLQFDQGIGETFDFPKDSDCSTIYCNIEGIHWVNHGTLLAASDKMKKKGKQHFRCREKDQSIHFFVLPDWSEQDFLH